MSTPPERRREGSFTIEIRYDGGALPGKSVIWSGSERQAVYKDWLSMRFNEALHLLGLRHYDEATYVAEFQDSLRTTQEAIMFLEGLLTASKLSRSNESVTYRASRIWIAEYRLMRMGRRVDVVRDIERGYEAFINQRQTDLQSIATEFSIRKEAYVGNHGTERLGNSTGLDENA